jgi:hypothetical protein
MKYQNKILSVLKEAINTSSEVQDIITATQNAENQFKSQGYGPDQAKTLAINAVTKSVMGDDDTINEVGDEKVHTAKFDRTDRADESIDTLEVPDDVEAKEQDYWEMQRLMQQAAEEAAEEGAKNESVVGKIKKDELERVMESLKPKKKIIKVKELKSKK